MDRPRITVGVPVYHGAEQVADALRCLQSQTYRDFEAIISVDGADAASADACRPFLQDARFRMVVHPERLDWFGNLNWLMQQPLNEFFCYRQHDDTTAPEFFETLLKAAEQTPQAAAVYADCQWMGGRNDIESSDSIEGEPLQRLLRYIEELPATPVRGLIRREAIHQAGLVKPDEFRGLGQILIWLAKVLRWGSFVRVPLPIYYRLDHVQNFYKSWLNWPEERKRAAWSTLFAGLLEAAMPLCNTPFERVFLQHVILDRVAVARPGRQYFYVPTNDPDACGKFIGECFDRLQKENVCPFRANDLPVSEFETIIETTQRTVGLEKLKGQLAATNAELASLKRSRMLRLGKLLRGLVGK